MPDDRMFGEMRGRGGSSLLLSRLGVKGGAGACRRQLSALWARFDTLYTKRGRPEYQVRHTRCNLGVQGQVPDRMSLCPIMEGEQVTDGEVDLEGLVVDGEFQSVGDHLL